MTERGRRVLTRNGHRYVFKKELAYNCQSQECVLRCQECVLVGETIRHNHPSSEDQVEVTKVEAPIKRRSQTTHDIPQQILRAALQKISETNSVNLSPVNNLKRIIHSPRKDNDAPPTPLRREDVPALPERYQVTNSGEQFLFFDSAVGEQEPLLIFVS